MRYSGLAGILSLLIFLYAQCLKGMPLPCLHGAFCSLYEPLISHPYVFKARLQTDVLRVGLWSNASSYNGGKNEAMDEKRRTTISKYLSKHLRHQPEHLGLELAPGGWVEVADLLMACRNNGFAISVTELHEVVLLNSKQRFAFDATQQRIRANQGHSVTVDLQLEPASPPAELYHGTTERNVAAIEREGLQPMRRHHVHLAADVATAYSVGKRHGKPVVFAVNAATMQQDGVIFFCSSNGVWLVDHVAPQYLRLAQAMTLKD